MIKDVLTNWRASAKKYPTPDTGKHRQDIWLAVAVAFALVVIAFYIGWDNNRQVPKAPLPGLHYVDEPHNPLSYMASWDGADYITIAEHGYTNLFWVNWFPLYPLIIAAVHFVIPSALDSALIIAWTCLIGALYFYIKIARFLFGISDDYEPLRALVPLVLFPTAVFFVAPFSESLFALLSLGSIYFALQNRWRGAAVLALLCSATHLTGILVVAFVGLILIEQQARIREVLATLVIGSLGIVGYMAYLQNKYHHPLAFIQSQQVYHHWTNQAPWNLLITTTPSNALMIGLVLASAVYWWKRRRSFSLYPLMYIAILLVGRQYGGFNRYVLMAFPIPLMLYGLLKDRKVLYPLVTAGLGIAWAYYVLQYAGGYIGS